MNGAASTAGRRWAARGGRVRGRVGCAALRLAIVTACFLGEAARCAAQARPADVAAPTPVTRLRGLYTTLTVSVGLVLIFVVASYLILRIGQRVSRSSAAPTRTTYVDAWSQYRLSDEQIAAATREPDDPQADGRPPA